MPRKKSVITEKQQTYVDNVLEGKSKSDAARAADMLPTKSTAIERSATVQAALKEARSELEGLSTLRRVDVLNGLMESIDMARTLAEPATMIAGWKEVAKIMGYYAPETRRIELSSDQSNVQKKLEMMSDQELLEMLHKRSLLVDIE
jgi:hypothetical protein